MRKIAILLGLMIALAPLAHAQSDVKEDWVVHYGSGQSQGPVFAIGLGVDSSGDVYVGGGSTGMDTDVRSFIINYNNMGEQHWVAEHKESGNYNQIRSMVVDQAGNVYVTGESSPFEDWTDYATAKYNSNGEQEWISRYDGPGRLDDDANAIAIDGSGNVYVVGSSMGSMSSLSDFAVVKYDSLGRQQWAQRYNGPGNLHDEAEAVAVDQDGNVYVTGFSTGAGSLVDIVTIKYDSQGVELWVKRYEAPMGVAPSAIAVDTSGNVYVTGSISDLNAKSNYITLKYDKDGNEKWAIKYNSSDTCQDNALDMVVDTLGNVYVTGTACAELNNTNGDYATIKYNTDGQEQWVKRFNGSGNNWDRANAMAIDIQGNIYVTGQSVGADTKSDYATVKYTSSGDQEWVMRYNSEANSDDGATDIAVDSAGNVYVTGTTTTGDTSSTITTIKYTQPSFSPSTDPDTTTPSSSLMPSTTPSCTQVGGSAEKMAILEVLADNPVDYLINISNRAGVSPADIAQEWLVFGIGMLGLELGPFFLTPTASIVPLTPDTNPSDVAFTFDHSVTVNRIIGCTPLGLQGLGLALGDYLWYAYAYSPTPVIDFANAPDIVLENAVVLVAR